MKIILTLLAGLLISCQAAPPTLKNLDTELKKEWPQNRVVNFVFHGHSVPAGYKKAPDVRPFESYPYLFHVALKENYPFAVTNTIITAIGGENSAQGAERFERDVLPHKPDLIFIDYGLNDRRISIEKTEAAWKRMIVAAKKANIPVVLLTPTGDMKANFKNPKDPLTLRAELIRKIAKEENVLLADVSAAWSDKLSRGTPQKNLMVTGTIPISLAAKSPPKRSWPASDPLVWANNHQSSVRNGEAGSPALL